MNNMVIPSSRVKLLKQIEVSWLENQVTVVTGIAGVGKTTLCRYSYENLLIGKYEVRWFDCGQLQEHDLSRSDAKFIVLNGYDECIPEIQKIIDYTIDTKQNMHYLINSRTSLQIHNYTEIILCALSLDESIELLDGLNVNLALDDMYYLLSKIDNTTPLMLKQIAYAIPLFNNDANLLPENNPDLLMTLNNIAGAYQSQGDYDKALAFYNKALLIREKVLGTEHPYTATTYHNIAGVYQAQGDYDKALAFYNKALLISEKVLGTEHPDTATTYNNIAGVYQAQGDYDKALAFYNKALLIREKVLGTEHPATATIYNNLAGVYQSQGSHEKALEFYYRALSIGEKVLGTEHPDTATTYNNIARVYKAQGDYDKALEFYRKALLIREKVLGTEHPATATTYNNLAGVYQVQGDYKKALMLYDKALLIVQNKFGFNHPNYWVINKNREICAKL